MTGKIPALPTQKKPEHTPQQAAALFFCTSCTSSDLHSGETNSSGRSRRHSMLGCTSVPLQNLWLTERRTVIETEKRRWIRRVTAPRVPWQIGDSSKIGRQCTQTESERPELLTSWRLRTGRRQNSTNQKTVGAVPVAALIFCTSWCCKLPCCPGTESVREGGRGVGGSRSGLHGGSMSRNACTRRDPVLRSTSIQC